MPYQIRDASFQIRRVALAREERDGRCIRSVSLVIPLLNRGVNPIPHRSSTVCLLLLFSVPHFFGN